MYRVPKRKQTTFGRRLPRGSVAAHWAEVEPEEEISTANRSVAAHWTEEEPEEEISTVNLTDQPGDFKLIPLKLDNTTCHFLPDTGSKLSFISEYQLRKL